MVAGADEELAELAPESHGVGNDGAEIDVVGHAVERAAERDQRAGVVRDDGILRIVDDGSGVRQFPPHLEEGRELDGGGFAHGAPEQRALDRRVEAVAALRRQHRPDLPPLDVAHDIPEDVARHHGGAGEGEVAQIEAAQVERDRGPGDGAGAGVAPAAREDVDQRRPAGPADDIGDDRDRLALQRGAQVLGRTRQDQVGAELRHVGVLGLGRHGDRPRAAAFRELDQRAPHAARGAGVASMMPVNPSGLGRRTGFVRRYPGGDE